jgi:hypothetical protein
MSKKSLTAIMDDIKELDQDEIAKLAYLCFQIVYIRTRGETYESGEFLEMTLKGPKLTLHATVRPRSENA